MKICLDIDYIKPFIINQNRPLSKLEAWIYLLLIADENGVIYKPISDLSFELKWSYEQVRYFLRQKSDEKLLNIDNSQLIHRITILNIDKYKVSFTLNSQPKSFRNYDYIDKIINIFQEEYLKQFKIDYIILNIGKERSAASKILGQYKKVYKYSDSEHTLIGLRNYFAFACSVNDNWLSQNMSLPIIVSKFNEINKYLKNGQYSKSGQQQSDEIGAIVDAVWDATKRRKD